MCNVCSKPEGKFPMTGLSGKMCTACHDAVLQARKGNLEAAENYFQNISIISEDALKYVQKELSDSKTISLKRDTETGQPTTNNTVSSVSANSLTKDTAYQTSERGMLTQIASDINTIKNILIFFLIVTIIGLGGTLLYVMQIVNTFRHLY